jgi:phosphoglycolate phosphatase-like HAD superfamily hydrolase
LGDAENDILAAKAAGLASCLFLPSENKIFYNFDKLKETNHTYCIELLKDSTNIVIG